MRKFLISSVLISVIGFGFAISSFAQSTPIPSEDISDIDFVFSEAPDDHVMGSDTAPLTMIAYASVTCGHCGNWFSNEWPEIKKALVDSGKMRFVMRPIPTPPAQLSMTGFIMAECAPDEKYFDVIQYQMENQQAIFDDTKAGKGREAYGKVAAIAGMEDEETINACLGNPANQEQLMKSGERGDAAKISGVPAFFISGEAYKGKQDAETFISLIESMIEAGTTKLPEIEPTNSHEGHDH
jgi:protein-disulfide isomerase